MKVTQSNTRPVAGLDRSPESGFTRPGTLAGSNFEAADQMDISQLSTYLAAAISGSPAHVQKLSALSEAVSNNEFRVDAGAVSEGIIQHSLLFSGAW